MCEYFFKQSQESIQENNFWNSTLRSYPTRDSSKNSIDQSKKQHLQQQQKPSPNTGLILIDLSYNKLSDAGGYTLAHLLSENKWILGMYSKNINR